MEIYAVAATAGRRRLFIDLTHWGLVEKRLRPFLVNSGWPQGLASPPVDIGVYIREVEEVYREALEEAAAAHAEFIKSARLWPLRFLMPVQIKASAAPWEVKTHVESVLGRNLAQVKAVGSGRAPLEVKNGAVYVGGVPSLGHTYLKLAGALPI
ncbi:hypothetical protein [Pyrobaculum neutrophilum]|uniref:Uncharacterized protein n=1 Tax=Pyrobaculum neutrophilum (strain DSM 2338 / JCM 9278 / NBRC 100436 / V24Sta) TaxID=444157 RepID=B1YA71_PYRNV|nr:hypothetical protein [Pyrobaculum neutrophilum]ACB39045.1 conserved hypothetical protein [Pyrobaculum neutrophilum V24Sta]